MEEVQVYCENTQAYESVVMGTTLKQLCQKLSCTSVLAALVDNKLKSLDYKIINPHNVQFIGYDHPDGRRTYIRSLCFVLQKVEYSQWHCLGLKEWNCFVHVYHLLTYTPFIYIY